MIFFKNNLTEIYQLVHTKGRKCLFISGSNVIQKGSSLGTEWQTPVISEAFRSRFSRCSSVADSGDTAIGTSCSDIAEGKTGLMI
jgi:centrosomal protein CEP85